MRWSFLLIVFSTRTLANLGGPKWQCFFMFFQSNDIQWDTNHECHESTMTHETYVLRWWRANSAPLGTVENNLWQSLYAHLGGGFNVFFLMFTLIWGRWTHFDEQDNPFLLGPVFLYPVCVCVCVGMVGHWFRKLGVLRIHILGQGQPQLRVRNMLGQDVAW